MPDKGTGGGEFVSGMSEQRQQQVEQGVGKLFGAPARG